MEEEDRTFSHDDIVGGINAARVKDLIDKGVLTKKQVFRVIPERTFARRLTDRSTLKVQEADAIGRLLRVTVEANRTFRDAEFAQRWLNLPNPALNGEVPIEMAGTDAGAREVEMILTRIAHGIPS
jgi:putative toxin-antitoxin system antitoxin component (TIGR02293 family)